MQEQPLVTPLKRWPIVLTTFLIAAAIGAGGIYLWQSRIVADRQSRISQLETELSEDAKEETTTKGKDNPKESDLILAAAEAHTRAGVAVNSVELKLVRVSDGFAMVSVVANTDNDPHIEYATYLKKVGDNWTTFYDGQEGIPAETKSTYGVPTTFKDL